MSQNTESVFFFFFFSSYNVALSLSLSLSRRAGDLRCRSSRQHGTGNVFPTYLHEINDLINFNNTHTLSSFLQFSSSHALYIIFVSVCVYLCVFTQYFIIYRCTNTLNTPVDTHIKISRRNILIHRKIRVFKCRSVNVFSTTSTKKCLRDSCWECFDNEIK